jgi:hypothetical protein
MRTLQVRDKPTTLARALSEIGRIAKTIHILHYIDDRAFRRRILTQLNHTELRHRLGRRIHHGERGEIRSPLQQGQEEQLGALGLALNAVVHWNALYMQEAIQQVRRDGMDVHNDDITHLSPLIWRHLNFLGQYDFSLPDTVINGRLRPLRNPTSAWDFGIALCYFSVPLSRTGLHQLKPPRAQLTEGCWKPVTIQLCRSGLQAATNV